MKPSHLAFTFSLKCSNVAKIKNQDFNELFTKQKEKIIAIETNKKKKKNIHAVQPPLSFLL